MSEKAHNNCSVKKPHERYLVVLLCLLSLMFLISLFKNISYPLFWADEGMTVMGGVRVLQYGYPKVHDGKNVFYDLLHPDTSLGIDEKTDAYIGGANWGQYYFATLGIKLAEISDDIFTKTAIIRVSFALIGLAGLVLFALLATQFFHTNLSRTGFLALFVFLEVLSVPLVLHLREARYYPLTFFFTAFIIFVYAQFRILKRTKYPAYAILLTASLFLLFFTFSPSYFIFLGAILLFESVLFVGDLFSRYGKKHEGGTTASHPQNGLFKNYFSYILPLILSMIIVYPLTVFFRTFHIASEMARYNTQMFLIDQAGMLRANFEVMWRFFASSDLMYLAIFLKICLLICFLWKSSGKGLLQFDRHKVIFSNFLTILFILYFFAIGKIPNFPFTRYFIPLQPVLTLIIIFDSAVLYAVISNYQSSARAYAKVAFVIIIIGFIVFHVYDNSSFLEGHLYELSHQYKGPLDYVIPYIQEKYGNTSDLVIATNYEETSFMYYLNAKVTIGYVGNNLEEDVRTRPDIVVYRKSWPDSKGKEIFMGFLLQNPYERISFPVMDYSVNNIPELNWQARFHHQFRTIETSDELEKIDIYIRK